PSFSEKIKEPESIRISNSGFLTMRFNYCLLDRGQYRTGGLFPFFSPFLGWIGVFLTGSDTSANALFSNLQAITAQQVGVSEVLLVAANTTGGVTGKMISPQSIAIACAAVGLAGKESDLFRFTVKHSLFFVIIVGIMTYVQAYYLTWMIP
ncbi:L-lactate permease, partial [Bacillus cereus group sp. BfR-BA-01356]|uniref:L-lactate permease n=1 Tax=Bacillus cereus group sp. BfR-BA-01356 TaxID=2920319 RepID=UPI001F572D14